MAVVNQALVVLLVCIFLTHCLASEISIYQKSDIKKDCPKNCLCRSSEIICTRLEEKFAVIPNDVHRIILEQELECSNQNIKQLAKLSNQRHIQLIGYCIQNDLRNKIPLNKVLTVSNRDRRVVGDSFIGCYFTDGFCSWTQSGNRPFQRQITSVGNFPLYAGPYIYFFKSSSDGLRTYEAILTTPSLILKKNANFSYVTYTAIARTNFLNSFSFSYAKGNSYFVLRTPSLMLDGWWHGYRSSDFYETSAFRLRIYAETRWQSHSNGNFGLDNILIHNVELAGNSTFATVGPIVAVLSAVFVVIVIIYKRQIWRRLRNTSQVQQQNNNVALKNVDNHNYPLTNSTFNMGSQATHGQNSISMPNPSLPSQIPSGTSTEVATYSQNLIPMPNPSLSSQTLSTFSTGPITSRFDDKNDNFTSMKVDNHNYLSTSSAFNADSQATYNQNSIPMPSPSFTSPALSGTLEGGVTSQAGHSDIPPDYAKVVSTS
ncbi:uncharacterized protein TRIADDRAFT_60905 [Trichoplax adhaerens]|uniref:MAM domain-containing protein n=1 Tax=Trichoplax adhaerens TaxID=10228 RepID=B3S9H1_TRIAD|nr:predicted protein [Trichoplax adhaerens]EDV20650.1 predicted protein [Trichoplax adhaerens]|eukprot:XP_002116850.1 predicted protein [Trichoplax adhaerens]